VFHSTLRNSVLYLLLTDKEDLITELKISSFLGANDCNLISLLYANRIKGILMRYRLGALKGQFNKHENNYETNQLGDRTQLGKSK